MKALRIFSAAMAIGLVGAALGDVAPEKKSTLTVTTPLEVPGTILDPGTYVVKLVDTQNSVVAITSVDGKKVYATALCTPHEAGDDPRHTEFMFYGVPDGTNKVLRTWYRPGDRYGQDFLYPPDRAAALRQVTNTQVPAMTAEQSAQLANRPAAAAVISDAEPPPPAPAMAAEPAPAPAPAAMTADASETLPKTASKTPLVLAAGILALGVASGLRFAGRS